MSWSVAGSCFAGIIALSVVGLEDRVEWWD